MFLIHLSFLLGLALSQSPCEHDLARFRDWNMELIARVNRRWTLQDLYLRGFDACRLGPEIPFEPGCRAYDIDMDWDVDLDDFGLIERGL